MISRLPLSFCLAVALAGLGGCAPSTPVARPAESWNWRNSPASDRLLLAQLPVRVAPVRATLVRLPATGVLTLTPGLDLAKTLPAGTEWARIEPADAAEENAVIDRLTAEIDRREQAYARLERPGLLIQLARDVRTAEDAAATAEFAENNTGLFTGERPALDPALRPALPAAQLKEAAASLRERHERILTGDPALDPADLRGLRDERERRIQARTTRARLLALVTPHAGRVVLTHRHESREIAVGETVALITDDSKLRASLRTALPVALAVPVASLEVEIALPAGGVLRAPFTERGLDATGEASLWFDAPADDAVAAVVGATGLDLPARLYTRLEAPARIVPKLQLARLDTHDALAAGWREAVPVLLPGTRFIAEGRAEVAVIANDFAQ